jgi:phospholipid/cholesterol/gamma-HCH transport system substrate-binding protein
MAESNQRTQLLAGIFVLCGLVLLGGLVMEFGPLQHRLRRPYAIHAVFSDAQNLIKGSPVRRAGAAIGRVATSPQLVDGLRGVKVSLEIYQEFKIPRGSQLKITTIGLMGDCAVDVLPPPPDKLTGDFIAPGETLDGVGGMDFTTVAEQMTDEATELMKDIRNGLSELNKTIARLNSEVLSDVNVKHVSESLTRLNSSLETIDTHFLTDENAASVRDSLALLKQTLEKALSASASADSAFAKMDKAMDHLGPGLKGFAGATDALRDASDVLEALLKEARAGRGLLYTLFNNTELRDNLERLIANMRRYGPVFYKDKAPPAAPAARPAPAIRPGQEPRRKQR